MLSDVLEPLDARIGIAAIRVACLEWLLSSHSPRAAARFGAMKKINTSKLKLKIDDHSIRLLTPDALGTIVGGISVALCSLDCSRLCTLGPGCR